MTDDVVDEVRTHLRKGRGSPEHPVPRLASVWVDDGRVAVLDLYLQDPSWLDEMRADPIPVSGIAHEIDPSRAISGDMNFVDAMDFVCDLERQLGAAPPGQWGALVDAVALVRDEAPVGVFTPDHFECVPVRVAVFSFLQEVEFAVLERAASSGQNAVNAMNAVDREVVRRAKRRLEDCGRKTSPLAIIRATDFRDKLIIARRLHWSFQTLTDTDFKAAVKQLNDVRNWCAHTGTGQEGSQGLARLSAAVTYARTLLAELLGSD
jgi:hypothetical protein